MYKSVNNNQSRWPAQTTKSISEPDSGEPTINVLRSDDRFTEQAGMIETTSAPESSNNGTVSFHDENAALLTKMDIPPDPTRGITDDPDVSYANFFSRPVELFSGQWNVGLGADFLFYPWKLWMENERVANRLSNFRNFRGNLKVKVVVNGNGFYWGGAICSYFPYIANDRFHYVDTNYFGDIMRATQRPYIYIDPALSQGGEMELPFFYNNDCFDLSSHDPVVLGQMWLKSLAPLRHANATDPIRYTIYAWCDNVVLSSPTQVNIKNLSPQGGTDEYEKPPASRAANIVTYVKGMGETVAKIGSFAMASLQAAETLGEYAAMAGLCKPRQIEGTKRVILSQCTELACVDSLDTTNSLAFSSKQEVTVDPAVAGAGSIDELAFREFASKESLIATVEWKKSNGPNTVLASLAVDPGTNVRETRALFNAEGINITPVGMVALPFTFWRGTMRYRFQVMSSMYHRGRMLLVWDPVRGSTSPEVQVARSVIVDLAEERDFSIDIGWGNNAPALSTHNKAANNSVHVAQIAPITTANGTLTLYVLNELTDSSTSSDPVLINVYMCSPDIEVFSPDSKEFRLLTPNPPGSAITLTEQSGDTDEVDASKPMGAQNSDVVTDKLARDVQATPAMFMHGDPVVNFRTLCKRYCYRETFVNDGVDNSYTIERVVRNAYPVFRGSDIDAFNGTTNIGPAHIRDLISACFAGWRGAIRFKLINTRVSPNTVCVSRAPHLTEGTTTTSGPLTAEGITIAELSFDESFSGRVYTNQTQGLNLEWEIPFYANRRFALAHHFRQSPTLACAIDFKSWRSFPSHYNLYSAVGDDFNLFLFRGVPTLYEELP